MKLTFFLILSFLITPCCKVVYSQNTSDSAIVLATCGVNDFISLYTYRDVTDMWSNNNSVHYFSRDKKTKQLSNIKISVRPQAIVYFSSKKLSQQSPIYLGQGDSITVTSESPDADFIFYGNKADEWNFYNKAMHVGFSTMGEMWKFNFTEKENFFFHAVKKRDEFQSFMSSAQTTNSLSKDFVSKFTKDAECIFLWSVIGTYEQNWKEKPDSVFIEFIKKYSTFFEKSNEHKSWAFYMALHTWNKFLAKYYYKIGVKSEMQFFCTEKLTAKLRDDLQFLILTTNEDWSSIGHFNRCIETFKKTCMNPKLIAHLILKIEGTKDSKIKKATNSISMLNYKVLDYSGRLVTWQSVIKKYRHKVVVIDLWASWCAPCKTEIVALQKLKATNPEKFTDIALINVSIDQDKLKWKKAVDNLGINDDKHQNVLINLNSELAKNLIPDKAVPRYLIIDKKGVIRVTDAPRPTSVAFWAIIEKLIESEI